MHSLWRSGKCKTYTLDEYSEKKKIEKATENGLSKKKIEFAWHVIYNYVMLFMKETQNLGFSIFIYLYFVQ